MRRKIHLIIFALIACLLSVNISAASMNHMDESNCMIQTACNNCVMLADATSSDIRLFHSVASKTISAPVYFESFLDAPPFPPPKK